jgi:putative membrane-bound dehydrogenase-like protein
MSVVLTLILLALSPPLSPELKISTTLSSPLTHHPVAMDWSPANHVWIAEFHPATPEGPEAKGTLTLLEDTNLDGTYDQRHVFADNLPPITSILDWPPGIIIAAPPDILYAEDTNNDHLADTVQRLFVGFNAASPSTSINGLQADVDGWIYAANGLGGGRVMPLPSSQIPQPPEPLNLANSDFRFHPGLGIIEPAAGFSPMGLNHDEWNHWISVDSSYNLVQLPIQYQDINRNPDATLPAPAIPILTTSGEQVRLPQANQDPDRLRAHATIWPGGTAFHQAPRLGPIFPGNLLLALPSTQNLWHLPLTRSNGLFVALQQPAPLFQQTGPEPFTPVQIKTGPDGAIWIVDPQFTSDPTSPHLGRILRLTDHTPHPMPPPVAPSNLIHHLSSPIATQRHQAHRFLLAQPDELPDLSTLAIPTPGTTSPEIQAHTLTLLHELQVLTPEILQWVSHSDHAELRALATRLSRTFLKSGLSPDSLLQLARDPSPDVQLELALALGDSTHPEVAAIWTSMLLEPESPTLIQTALLSSATNQPLLLLESLLQQTKSSPFSPTEIRVSQTLTRSALRSHDPNTVMLPLSDTPTPNSLAAMAQLLKASAPPPNIPDSSPLLNWVRLEIHNPNLAPQLRSLQFTVLGFQPAHLNSDLQTLLQACIHEPHASVRETAVQSLCHNPSPLSTTVLIQNWQRLRPHLRPIAIDLLLQSESATSALLQALENSTITASEISPANRPRLLQHPNPSVQARAAKLLPPPASVNPSSPLETFKSALLLPGKPEAGKTTFQMLCQNCHAPSPPLLPVGPNLSSIGQRTPMELYQAVLNPNSLVEPAYQAYFIETINGESLTGLILNDSSNSISILSVGGTIHSLPFNQIDAIRASNLSLMPEGLEAALNPQSLADLLAYLHSLKPQANPASSLAPPPHLPYVPNAQ